MKRSSTGQVVLRFLLIYTFPCSFVFRIFIRVNCVLHPSFLPEQFFALYVNSVVYNIFNTFILSLTHLNPAIGKCFFSRPVFWFQ